MTITIDSIWVLIGIAIVLGFGGYLGLSAAIALRKSSEWLGLKLGDFILYIINLIKRRREKNSND